MTEEGFIPFLYAVAGMIGFSICVGFLYYAAGKIAKKRKLSNKRKDK
jgi:hypothetical protein